MISNVAPLSIGRYTLFAEIGRGGMAAVHVGRLKGPLGFSRTVAIKRLLPELAHDPSFVTMLVDEARMASRVNHANVVQTIDIVTHGGEVLLVLEYVHGESLADLLDTARISDEPPTPEVAVSITCGVLYGLHAAHEATGERGRPLGLVHRDVSPQNVLVGKDGIARVLDFGVAKAVGRAQGDTGVRRIKGKIAYMAPEQALGDATRKSDVYATGVMLWEMLVGRGLFHEPGRLASLDDMARRHVEPPSSVAASPPALDAVVLRAVAPDPAARYPTALDMARALEAAIDPATPAAVGDWVARTARDGLETRAQRLAEIEGRTIVTAVAEIIGMPSNQGRAPRPRERSRRKGALVAVMATLAVGGGAWALKGLRAATPQSAASALAAAPSPDPAPAPSPDPEVSASVATVAEHPPLSAPTVRAPTTRPLPAAVPRSPRARGKRPDCSVPYSVDANGTKRYRDECL